MALEHNVLVVSVSAALSGPRDPCMAEKRIDDFVDALRRVTKQGNAIIIFDPQKPEEPCTCDEYRSKHCNCKDKSRCTCPRLRCPTCKLVAQIDTEKYAADLTSLYATHMSHLSTLTTAFTTAASLAADFARDTKSPAAVFRRIWRLRGGCPRDCRGYLHLWCGHARSWTRAPTLETYIEFRLMRQRVGVEEAWEGFKGVLVGSGIFRGGEVRVPGGVEGVLAGEGEGKFDAGREVD